ncbi:hypothetical protein CO731_00351 [Aminobacter sp. MSH1]|nr:hypothetical protein CO731_00351 [Aminobacter sp. MSH1]
MCATLITNSPARRDTILEHLDRDQAMSGIDTPDISCLAALTAIAAAVVGVVMNLALWFALHVVFGEVRSIGFGPDLLVLSSVDWRAAFLAIAAMVAMLKFNVGMIPTLAASAVTGLVLHQLPL